MDFDVDSIVDIVTREIVRRLGESENSETGVLLTDGCPDDLVSGNYDAKRGGADGCKYVLLTAEAYKALTSGGSCAKPADAESEKSARCDGEGVDLRGKRLLHERDMREHNVQRDTVIKVSKKTIITALAHDYAKGLGVRIIREN
jgi:hypothetical protein